MRAQTVHNIAYIFDFDETLVTTDAKIHIYRNGVFFKSLNSRQYNSYRPSAHDKVDFSEFKDGELILNAKKYKTWPIIKSIKDTTDIYILTARSSIVKSYIYEFLKKNGIKIELEHIITIGDDIGKIDISQEKRKWLHKLSQKYDRIFFFDDDPKTIAMASSIQGIKPKLIENMKQIKEDAMGGISGPMSTLNNTPGMGTAVLGSATTNMKGSGDKWGNTIGGKPYTQVKAKSKKKKLTKKKKYVKEKIEEENVSPYDQIGQMMLKRAKVKNTFKKKKEKGNQNAVVQKKFEHEIITFDEFTKQINEKKRNR